VLNLNGDTQPVSANFSNCGLTGASFELAAIELIKASRAVVEGVKVRAATFYGCELAELTYDTWLSPMSRESQLPPIQRQFDSHRSLHATTG